LPSPGGNIRFFVVPLFSDEMFFARASVNRGGYWLSFALLLLLLSPLFVATLLKL
jgi:hypothetical protein